MAFAHPVPFLDDAAIHVHDEQRSVRCGGHIHRAKICIGGADEFILLVSVAESSDSIRDLHFRPTDQTPHGFGEQQIAAQIRRKSVAAEKFISARGGEMIQRFVLGPETSFAALHIRQAHQRPYLGIPIRKFTLGAERAVNNRLLKIQRPALAARIHEPRFSEIVLTDSPLSAIGAGGFLDHIRASGAETIGVVSRIHPVIQGEQQSIGLMFQISTARATGEPQRLLIRHAIAVRVAIQIDIARIRFTDQDPITIGQ